MAAFDIHKQMDMMMMMMMTPYLCREWMNRPFSKYIHKIYAYSWSIDKNVK